MRLAGLWLAGFALASGAVPSEPAWAASEPSVLLGDLTWPEAERALKPETVVVIPLGAQAKEHGLHLQLDADFVMAEYFKTEVMARTNVVVAPTGVWGDATLATSDKGKVLVRAVLDGMLADIQALRAEPLPGGRRE